MSDFSVIFIFCRIFSFFLFTASSVHIVNVCHIVYVSHINHVVCTGYIVHCLSCRHQSAGFLKQIKKQQKYLLLHSLCISFYTHFLFTCAVLHYALCVSIYIHIFLDFCMTLYTHFCFILYRSHRCL